MKRYFIETAKCNVLEGRTVVATVKFNDGIEDLWISLIDFEGTPEVYLSDKDIYDDMKDDFMDGYAGRTGDYIITEFERIVFDVDYYMTFESISQDQENPAAPLIRYLITLVRCPMEEVEELIRMATGKYADELDIPMSDVEQEFMDEYDELIPDNRETDILNPEK